MWAALPGYLDNVIESVQNRALGIMLSNPNYREALLMGSRITPPVGVMLVPNF